MTRTDTAAAVARLAGGLVKNAATAPFRDNSPPFRVRDASFSPDSKFLVMEYLHTDKKSVLAVWDNENEQLHKLPVAPKGRSWVTPSFSTDGERITFADCEFGGRTCQIAMTGRNGTNFSHLLSTVNEKYPRIEYPSYSPDGRKLIFARSTGHFGKQEIFEFDLETGSESQKTNSNFISILRPRYLPDSRNFIFHGKSQLTWDVKDIPPGNHILVMGPDYGFGLMPNFTRARSSSDPSMSADGTKILFVSRTNDLDGIELKPLNKDLFIRTDSRNHRITSMGLIVSEAVLSPDGKTVFFYADIARAPNWRPTSKKHVYAFWLMNSDGTNMREIRFPDQPQN